MTHILLTYAQQCVDFNFSVRLYKEKNVFKEGMRSQRENLKNCCVFLFVRESVITTGSLNTFAYIHKTLILVDKYASTLTKTVHFL